MTEVEGIPDIAAFNRSVIAEFRANKGRVGGRFEGETLVLLHTVGARTGRPRLNPMVSFADGEVIFVVASHAGAPTSPDWFHNLRASPEVTVERGAEVFPARARVLTGEERDRRYAWIVEQADRFTRYQERTTRVIPVVELRRLSLDGG
jgi:deazaflavin-dependent oxidoreductase (nitroreductase family)